MSNERDWAIYDMSYLVKVGGLEGAVYEGIYTYQPTRSRLYGSALQYYAYH